MYAILVRYVEMSDKLSRATPTCMRRLRIGGMELGFYLASLDAAITRPTCTCAGFGCAGKKWGCSGNWPWGDFFSQESWVCFKNCPNAGYNRGYNHAGITDLLTGRL